MEFVRAILLGVVQGITEFLPVSSSGHLIIVSWFMDHKPLSIALNVALHVGSFSAVLIYFWRDWWKIIQNCLAGIFKGKKSFEFNTFLPALIIGSIPAGIVGILGRDFIEKTLHHPVTTVFTLSSVGILLWWGDKKSPQTKNVSSMNFKDAFIIGLCQAVALIPGVSRSGATILGGRLLGYSRQDAAKFSFLLGTPAMLGAALLEGKNIINNLDKVEFYLGMICSAIVGCLAIKLLLVFLNRYSLLAFAVYRVALAVVIAVIFFVL